MLWLCKRSNPPSFIFLLLPTLFLWASSIPTFAFTDLHTRHPVLFGYRSGYRIVVPWETRRHLLADENVDNSSLILAEKRTDRKDPLNDFKRYIGGWNISNEHYWASVGFTAAPFFVIAGIWFVLFGLVLFIVCLRHCCCPREPYGYSRTCYALSLIFLILFTVAAIVGCVVLYTGQAKFHDNTSKTLDYVVNQADDTVYKLRNVSDYLATAKKIGVDAMFLPANVQNEIDTVQTKINSSASTLDDKAQKNSKRIQDVLDKVRLDLIILAGVMLVLAFVGFLFSILGLQTLVYILVIVGWILVAGTFILCGVFLLLHNVAADTCLAMGEWLQYPTLHTALDDILPCVDNATAQETLIRTKDVTYNLVNVVDTIITNVTNVNFPPQAGPVYFNQSGPRMPTLCNPFNSDLTNRQCAPGEVGLDNATEAWKGYVCQASGSGICSTPGRLTPSIYSQMTAAVNVSYGLYRYGPFLVDLEDCTFVRRAFTDISRDYCPGMQRYTEWVYVGLVLVAAAVMLSLIFWVIYARERRHRVYTKQSNARAMMEEEDKGA